MFPVRAANRAILPVLWRDPVSGPLVGAAPGPSLPSSGMHFQASGPSWPARQNSPSATIGALTPQIATPTPSLTQQIDVPTPDRGPVGVLPWRPPWALPGQMRAADRDEPGAQCTSPLYRLPVISLADTPADSHPSPLGDTCENAPPQRQGSPAKTPPPPLRPPDVHQDAATVLQEGRMSAARQLIALGFAPPAEWGIGASTASRVQHDG
jgi:hypothetical protein